MPRPGPPTRPGLLSGAAIDARRVLADLRGLAERTSDERGAQRLCWTQGWTEARSFLEGLLADIGAHYERDEAGNLWASIHGEDPSAPALVVGSHIDSVPDGGWLDGALGVMAGVGVLRAWSEADGKPPRPIVLVDWADEEGARFGRSLFGSSAFAGTLDPESVRDLRDASGTRLADALAGHDVDVERATLARERREGLGEYLELHIEQGPVLEAEGVRVAAVAGCQGIERVRFSFTGQASHAGTTPMDHRRDAGLAAADAALRIARIPADAGGVATCGELRLAPGVATAVPGRAELSCDLRNPEAGALEAMRRTAEEAVREAAADHGCGVELSPIWRIEPIPFDPRLVGLARDACEEATGAAFEITSGALHDAAEVARVLPAAMMFCPSRAGISHAREEDTDEEDLVAAIAAFGELARKALG